MRYASIGSSILLVVLLAAQVPGVAEATTNDEKPVTVLQYLGERATRMASRLPATPDTLKAWEQRRYIVQQQLALRLGLPARVPMRAKSV